MMTMMKRGLSGLFVLLLLLSSTVSGLGSVVSKYYQYIQMHYTWQDAQSFCRSYYTDLATIYTQSDTNGMYLKQYFAWIGLHKGAANSGWIWSNGVRDSLNGWAKNEPHDSDRCALVYYDSKLLYGTDCEQYLFFICYDYHHALRRYTFISQSKTWSEARQYCKNMYYDLSIFLFNLDEVVDQDFPVWTGLHRDGETWKWSTGLSEYRKWASNEPGNDDDDDCVSISSLDKEMAAQNCSARFPFVCFKDNLVLVKENKTWVEALEHCRALMSPYPSSARYELLSVQPGGDHNYVVSSRVMEAATEKVWTGLRFLAGHWLWVNGADMLYSGLPVCPIEGQLCGALSKNDTGSVESTDCLEKMNFLCYSTW